MKYVLNSKTERYVTDDPNSAVVFGTPRLEYMLYFSKNLQLEVSAKEFASAEVGRFYNVGLSKSGEHFSFEWCISKQEEWVRRARENIGEGSFVKKFPTPMMYIAYAASAEYYPSE